MFDSIYITVLKWQHYRNGNRLVVAMGYNRVGGRREMLVAIKSQNEGSLWHGSMSHPGHKLL